MEHQADDEGRLPKLQSQAYKSYDLNSLKGGDIGEYMGVLYGAIKWDTGSLDYSSQVSKVGASCLGFTLWDLDFVGLSVDPRPLTLWNSPILLLQVPKG